MMRANFLWEPDIQTFMLHWIPILFMGVLCVSVIVLMRYMPEDQAGGDQAGAGAIARLVGHRRCR